MILEVYLLKYYKKMTVHSYIQEDIPGDSDTIMVLRTISTEINIKVEH